MKRIFKKNQLIITALAALIAVAGYLNYTEKNINDKTKEASAKQQSTQSQNEKTDVSKNDNKDTSEDDKVSQVKILKAMIRMYRAHRVKLYLLMRQELLTLL